MTSVIFTQNKRKLWTKIITSLLTLLYELSLTRLSWTFVTLASASCFWPTFFSWWWRDMLICNRSLLFFRLFFEFYLTFFSLCSSFRFLAPFSGLFCYLLLTRLVSNIQIFCFDRSLDWKSIIINNFHRLLRLIFWAASVNCSYWIRRFHRMLWRWW